MANGLHVIYGMFREGSPRIILYVGSATLDGMPHRLGQHLRGECRTTKKMAARQGMPLSELRMRVLCLWRGKCPEHHIMRLCQAFGIARWNGWYAFSHSDCERGGHNVSLADRQRGGRAKVAMHGVGHILTPFEGQRGGKAARALHGQNYSFTDADRRRHRNRTLEGIEAQRNGSRRGALATLAKYGSPFADPAKGNHIRWHVRRGITNPDCIVCARETRNAPD